MGEAAAHPSVTLHYQPHPPEAAKVAPLIDGQHPQEAFHSDRYHVTYRAAFAGTGAGKTAAGAFELIAWMIENPGCVCIACEPDYGMIQRVMMPALADVLGVQDADALETSPLVKLYNKTEHRLVLWNGSTCWFIGLEDPQKVEGPNVDFVWADEVRLVRRWKEAWKQLKRRLRGSRPGARTGAIVTTHSPTKEQMEAFEGPNKTPGARCYRWSSYDNPLLARDYLRELEADNTGPNRKAVILGEFAQAEGRVFSEFVINRSVVPRPDVPIPERAPAAPKGQPPSYVPWAERVSYGVDWGHGMPAAIVVVLWAGEIGHIVEEVYGSGYSVKELAEAAKGLVSRWGSGRFYCGHDRPEHIKEFVAAGLDAVSIQGVKGAFVKADGLATMNSMFKGDELRVAPECQKWMYEEERYVWKPGQEDKETEKGNDHAIDASRYAVMGERARPKLVWGSVSSR